MTLTALKSAPFHVYGDLTYRGKCPTEAVEQATFFNRLRLQYPQSYGRIGLHIRNEGKRTMQQIRQQKAEGGFVKGASDIVIPGAPCLIIELKRKDPTKSKWQDGQQEYLEAAHKAGAFACVAFGCEAAWEAFQEWLTSQQSANTR